MVVEIHLWLLAEAPQLALQANTNDIIVRTDIPTISQHAKTQNKPTGTLTDYEQASFTALEFLSNQQ